MKKLSIMLSLLLLLSQAACLKSGSKSDKNGQLLGATVVYLSSIWQKVTPADVDPNFKYNGLAPGCSACPPTVDSTTGKTTTYNPDFAFFVKRGAAGNNNLLIFFMGGGACWDITNCVYNHTYSPELIESKLFLGLGSTGTLESKGLGGIMDMTNPDNPFLDWTIVWVPYCTGDLGLGANDNSYADHPHTGTYPDPGGDVVIRHRGLVNVKLVLKWLEKNITTAPTKLFVTGVSAGSYTAVMSFPLIRTQYSATPTAYVLGDAGVGVAGEYDEVPSLPEPIPFMKIVESKWGLVLPSPVFDGKSLETDYHYNYKELFQAIANYYAIDKPNDRFAQYTAKWDKTQTWFYNIQNGDSINHPDTWGSEASADPDPNAWSGLMMPPGVIDIGTANYHYYIGPGTNHTIILFPEYYTEVSGGVPLFEWVNSFVNDDAVIDQECAACPLP